jgi:O-methyltransferase
MIRKMKGLLKRTVLRLHNPSVADMEKEFLAIWKQSKQYTMTSVERGYALFKAVEHIVKHDIPGDFVECGVWRGGSACVAARSLLHFGDRTRDLYLYDTYTGMVKPTERDVSASNVPAQARWEAQQADTHNEWCYAARADVEHNVRATGYPGDKLHFVEGKVEETIPAVAPERIALLRLDTDWYESTRHELRELYPRLVPGGILIIDDYGAWKGAREATDEYFAENDQKVFLSRIDMTGRLAIKG